MSPLLFDGVGLTLSFFHSIPDLDNTERAVKELEVGDEAGPWDLS